MRCKDCEYPLWNLKARSCPECGKDFRPSDHEFVANSVRFCCPHCDQAYYGTDRSGHIVPPAFDCVRCHAAVTMDEMILRPSEGVAESQTKANAMPWLDRGESGAVKAWFRTVGRSMVAPGRLMHAVPVNSPMTTAWWYATLTIAIILFFGGGLPLIGLGAVLLLAGENDGLGVMISSVWVVLGGTAAFLVATAVWGLIVHGVLRVSGKLTHSLGRTYQALCYSIGANVTSAVPILGLYPFIEVGLAWWIVSAILMVIAAHRVKGGRGSIAVLVCPVAVILLGGASLVGLMVFGMKQVKIAQAAAVATMPANEATLITRGLRDYAKANDGAWPIHVVDLLRAEHVDAWDFVSAGSSTYLENVPISDVTMEDFRNASSERRLELIDAALELSVDAIVAYRFGDFVFCYPGVTDAAPPETWIVLLAPDPEHNEVTAIKGFLIAGQRDGGAAVIPIAELEAKLAEQNVLRASLGLAPIPPPSEITHSMPVLRP